MFDFQQFVIMALVIQFPEWVFTEDPQPINNPVDSVTIQGCSVLGTSITGSASNTYPFPNTP